MPEYPNIQIKVVSPVTLIKPAATELVDREAITLVDTDVLRYIEENKPEQVVVTLKTMSRYSSEAIGGLIRAARRVRKYGGEIKLAVSDQIREVFRVTHLEGNVFEIFETESDAIASYFAHGGDLF